MITVRLTENYGGFQIEGGFDDLNQFYDDLGSVIGVEESQDEDEELQRLLILGLMYEIRHAYQGDRMVKLNGEELCARDDERWNRGPMMGMRYAFNYYLVDFLTCYIIIRPRLFPTKKSGRSAEYEDLTSAHYRIVGVFAQAVEQLAAVLTPIQMNKAKRLLDLAAGSKFTIYRGAWLEVITTGYLRMTAQQRKKEIMRSISATCEYHLYDDFHEMCRDIKAYAERNHCAVKNVHMSNSSDYADVIW